MQLCSAMVDMSHDGRHIAVMWCGGSYATVVWHDSGRTCGMVATVWQLCGVMVVVLRLWWGCGGSHIVSRWLHGMATAGSRMAWWWWWQSCCGGCGMAVVAVAAAMPWQ